MSDSPIFDALLWERERGIKIETVMFPKITVNDWSIYENSVSTP